jgi:hypothetical protein
MKPLAKIHHNTIGRSTLTKINPDIQQYRIHTYTIRGLKIGNIVYNRLISNGGWN